ncbi:MAG: N-acetylmuramoyl-L-alanine amidase [Defluviitaleaceae bacterium]|nr:N-acetylmuramoyl-L-alanine amidase [Defluviitaleaceae bacterium]
MNLNIVQDFIPVGRRNRPGRVNPMLFVTIHETGNTNRGANARAHGKYLRGNDAANLPVSWHYTVDDSVTVQHLPENEDTFHAGDGAGSGNRQSIGIEMAVNSDGNFQTTIDRTAALVADICIRRNIPIANIRQHFHWIGKNCLQNIRAGRPITWAVFLEKVQAAMDAKTAPPVAPPTTPTTPALVETVNFDLFGKAVEIDGMIIGGRTFVAARHLLESMGGYSVGWNGSTNTVIVRRVAN